ncbi:hypothetical protein DENSPDRAFT_283536 [Dentipellis sp. KUC8613]|nr:hypothetical protein DENSPDRAFT_283536 [Dentipellis sp. KUC8613]
MIVVFLAEVPNSQQCPERGPSTAPGLSTQQLEALREEWKSFSERYVKFMEVRQAMKAEMVTEHGWNSPQSNEAGEKLVSFHTRIRVDWHDRLRERGLHPRMCEGVLTAEEKELLVWLIGEPVFKYKASEDQEEVAVPSPASPTIVAQVAASGRSNPHTKVEAWLQSLGCLSSSIGNFAGAVQAPPLPPRLLLSPLQVPLSPLQVPLSPPKIPYHTRPNLGPQGKIRPRRERYYDVIRPQMQFPNP